MFNLSFLMTHLKKIKKKIRIRLTYNKIIIVLIYFLVVICRKAKETKFGTSFWKSSKKKIENQGLRIKKSLLRCHKYINLLWDRISKLTVIINHVKWYMEEIEPCFLAILLPSKTEPDHALWNTHLDWFGPEPLTREFIHGTKIGN